MTKPQGRPTRKRKAPSGTSSNVDDNRRVRWSKRAKSTTASIVSGEHDDETGAEEAEEEEEEEEKDNSGKICLSAHCQNGRFGCAYYDPSKRVIYTYEDSQENNHFDLTKSLLEQCNPDMVITSSRADEAFIDVLREFMEKASGIFQIRPHKEYMPAKGRSKLLSLRMLSDLPLYEQDLESYQPQSDSSRPTNAYDFMRRRQKPSGSGDPIAKMKNAAIRLSNFANSDSSPLCMSSVGALIDHLVREQAMAELDDEGAEGLDVTNIESLGFNEAMQVNSDTLISLQIFADESHASIHSTKTKEGLSLFGTLNNTVTQAGRSLLRSWLLRPSLCLPVINARHNAVQCFTLTENMTATNTMKNCLKDGVKNVTRALGLLGRGKATVKEWMGIVKFTFHCAMLRDALLELSGGARVEIVRKLADALDIACFKEIGNAINETIDWEESFATGRICIRPRVDEELDNRKTVYNGIDTVLSKVAVKISHDVPPDYAETLNVVYFPQLGFLVCVPMQEEWNGSTGIQELPGWTFQFSSESFVYFKCQEMRDMDIHIGDLLPVIIDREIEIIQALLERVILPNTQTMSYACEICAELDVLLAFSEVSTTYSYVRPEIRGPDEVGGQTIDIKGGRHPLQEQVVDVFVPNDAYVVGGCGKGSSAQIHDPDDSDDDVLRKQTSVILCTGANACGKSVYLKQIALIQFMAQVVQLTSLWIKYAVVSDESRLDRMVFLPVIRSYPGLSLCSFVPAESAALCLVDKLFTRVSTRESVSKVQSSFMIDLNQVSFALRNMTSRSLILLDEFGKGTLTEDGAGLFCGVLNYLLGLGDSCPKVLVATHFHEVFKPGLFDPWTDGVTFLHMEIMFSSTSDSGKYSDETSTKGVGNVVRPGDKITYLFRVAPGLSLTSHAAQCAEMFGVPAAIVARAQYVSELIAAHEIDRLLEEAMTEEDVKDLQDAEAVFKRFLDWRLDESGTGEGGVRAKLAEILGIDDYDENTV